MAKAGWGRVVARASRFPWEDESAGPPRQLQRDAFYLAAFDYYSGDGNVLDICRRYEMSPATFYKYKRRFTQWLKHNNPQELSPKQMLIRLLA